MQIPVYSIAGQVVDHIAVDEGALGGEPNRELIRQAVLTYEANQRLGTAKVKTRHEVAGSGRKPWPQKHTGRARHGTRTSPIWVGGGVTHGPKQRDFRKKMTRKARRQATRSAFLAKALDGEVLAIDGLELPEAKTREMARILKLLGVERTFLLVVPAHDALLWRCTRNIPGAAMAAWAELNAYALLRPRQVLFTRQALEEFLAASAADPTQGAGVSNG